MNPYNKFFFPKTVHSILNCRRRNIGRFPITRQQKYLQTGQDRNQNPQRSTSVTLKSLNLFILTALNRRAYPRD